MRYLGIDIGGTAIKIGVVNESGYVYKKDTYPLKKNEEQIPLLEAAMESCDLFLQSYQVDLSEIRGIGISATGQIDSLSGCVIGVGGNIKNWHGARIKERFEERYHLPVAVINDANSVALAEQQVGAAKGCKDVIVITVGTGLGGGIITGGHLLLGNKGLAGEIGHFSIDKNGRKCTCGNLGCYEQYASMTALIREIVSKISVDHNPFGEKAINGETIFELVKAREPISCKAVDKWMKDIATGLISLTHIFNPQKILIGGGVSVQNELFVKKVRKIVIDGVMENYKDELKIERAKLGNDAGLIGAVCYLVNINFD